MRFSIRMTGRHYEQLVESLQCSEGHEKVAALFCGRGRTETAEALCVQEVWPLPNHCDAHPHGQSIVAVIAVPLMTVM